MTFVSKEYEIKKNSAGTMTTSKILFLLSFNLKTIG